MSRSKAHHVSFCDGRVDRLVEAINVGCSSNSVLHCTNNLNFDTEHALGLFWTLQPTSAADNGEDPAPIGGKAGP